MKSSMPPAGSKGGPDNETTRPPQGALRFDMPEDLFAAMPQLAELTQHRPRAGEEPLSFLGRLRSSTTPEEAVTFTAFAALPEMAIWWGYECLRLMPEAMDANDRALMEKIARWLSSRTRDYRHQIMQEALWAPGKSPVTMLALAVGWSGGSIAPNDPAAVPPWRTPRSINSAVLSCLARTDLSRRSVFLARFIDMSEQLYRFY